MSAIIDLVIFLLSFQFLHRVWSNFKVNQSNWKSIAFWSLYLISYFFMINVSQYSFTTDVIELFIYLISQISNNRIQLMKSFIYFKVMWICVKLISTMNSK